jgi:hypothetical protein
MTKSILFEIDAQIALLRQAKALLSSTGTTAIKRVQDSSHRRSGCPKGDEAQEDECRGARTRPPSADQALGRSEAGRQGHRRSTVEFEEESREGRCLTGSCGVVIRLNTAIPVLGIVSFVDV